MMQGASPVSSQYLPDFLTPEPQHSSIPRPAFAPDVEQPSPPHWLHSTEQQITSFPLMPGISPGQVWAAQPKTRARYIQRCLKGDGR